MKSMKKYLAELIGTFVLVVFACGVAAVSGCNGATFNTAYVGTAAAFGLVIVAMAYSIGNVSGCHINPAVSVGMLVAGRMSFKDFVGYVVSQFIGATLGAYVLKAILYGSANPVECVSALGQNGLYNSDTLLSIAVEVILTAAFVLTILGATSKNANGGFAGLSIGGSLFLVHLLGIHFTGTSVNPARSFGPALFTGTLNVYPAFLIGPMVGGILAALLWKLIATEKD